MLYLTQMLDFPSIGLSSSRDLHKLKCLCYPSLQPLLPPPPSISLIGLKGYFYALVQNDATSTQVKHARRALLGNIIN